MRNQIGAPSQELANDAKNTQHYETQSDNFEPRRHLLHILDNRLVAAISMWIATNDNFSPMNPISFALIAR